MTGDVLQAVAQVALACLVMGALAFILMAAVL
jgi:hypothetical protein